MIDHKTAQTPDGLRGFSLAVFFHLLIKLIQVILLDDIDKGIYIKA